MSPNRPPWQQQQTTRHESGFLASWLRDLGAAIGLIAGLIGLTTGLVAIFKAFFEGRPSSYLEPDELDWTLKLYVLNTGRGSIVINRFRILPRHRWYVAPNASLRHTIHSAVKGWNNVIIEPGKRHEFYLGLPHNKVSQLRRSEENTLEGDSQEGIV
jgi:hypothetical protein